MIGRAQGVDGKLAGGVLHPGFVRRVYLEFGVVRRRRNASTALAAELDDGNGQRRTLGRVGSGSELIEETERIGVRPI